MTATTQNVDLTLGPGNFRRIARGSGLTPQHISRVLRGRKGTSLRSAALIADAAGVTLDELRAYIDRQLGEAA